MANLSISLTPELVGMIEAKVESGRYRSASEVVSDALRLFERADKREADVCAQLRQAWEEIAEGDNAGRRSASVRHSETTLLD